MKELLCPIDRFELPQNVDNVVLFPLRKEERAMATTPEHRKAFVARLKQACNESKLIPAEHDGRQQFIADRLQVVPEAVSKWFRGVAMPRPEKLQQLADLLEVDQAWLAFGLAPEMDRAQRRSHAKQIDGAVHLVLGMMTLAGGHCGLPAKNDPRSNYVDFYTTMRGSVYPIHVAMAREVSANQFEILLPKEYTDVRSVAVVPAGPGKYHFLDMPLALINEHKGRKAGQIQIAVNRVEGNRYITGSDSWPRIKTFGELA